MWRAKQRKTQKESQHTWYTHSNKPLLSVTNKHTEGSVGTVLGQGQADGWLWVCRVKVLKLAVQERQCQAGPWPQSCSVFITLSLFKNTARCYVSGLHLKSPTHKPFCANVCMVLAYICSLNSPEAHYPNIRQLTTRTNPQGLLAFSVLPCIGIRMPKSSIHTHPPPLPGVPVIHQASNPTWAFLNFRGTSADESLDLWLADGQWRVKRGWGLLQRGFVVVLSHAHWCTHMHHIISTCCLRQLVKYNK